MPNITLKRKNIAFHNRGDKIEVKLLDNSWNCYRSWQVGITDHKGLKKMIEELKDYNIDFKRLSNGIENWFE